ncbi:Rrf2 family transcriptional regulator [bacterium]|nr:Rrf2 family transcriptional regulator [candidate division CSSED10-310 bacterium]
MNKTIRMSEAVSIAFHSAVYLANKPKEMISAKSIADELKISEAHLSKVLQRLVKVGLMRSNRGPRGGYGLAREPVEITLLDLYEAVEGPIHNPDCMFGYHICKRDNCIFRGLHETIFHVYLDYLEQTRIHQLID